jgi:hypothetical protein
MKELDGDDAPLMSHTTGKSVERDIVQFVAFRDLKVTLDPYTHRPSACPEAYCCALGRICSEEMTGF